MALTNLLFDGITTLVLMLVLYVLSHIVLRFGLVPLCAALSFSDFNSFLFYLFILPGTVIHELSHLLACLLTGVKVRDFRLFSPQKNGVVGWVTYAKVDIFRRNLVSLAPFVGSALVLYLLSRYFFSHTGIALAPVHLRPALSDLGRTAMDLAELVRSIFGRADFRHWQTWLFLYLAFSLSYGIAPSPIDLSHVLVDALIFVGAGVLAVYAENTWRLGILSSSLFAQIAGWISLVLERLNALLFFSAAVVIFSSLLLLPVAYLAYKLRRGD
ncbi:MAG: M50 family metallopeptidase [Chloroflexi bacterium]|nr:M50 family metallopeptidase [Chloroflexota bacterium]